MLGTQGEVLGMGDPGRSFRKSEISLLRAVCSRPNLEIQKQLRLIKKLRAWFPSRWEKPLIKLAVGLNSHIIHSENLENQA